MENIENKEQNNGSYIVAEGVEVLNKIKLENPDVNNFLKELTNTSISKKEFSKMIGDFNESHMHKKEGTYQQVFITWRSLTQTQKTKNN